MTSILVCFNLGLPADEQTQQISLWLDFLNSSLPLPPLPVSGKVPKWNITLVGVHSDEQQDFSITGNSQMISSWRRRWPRLPICSSLFTVSSLTSVESVQELLSFVESECGRIMDTHATQIPSSYKQFISTLQDFSKDQSLIHWEVLFNQFGPQIKMAKQAFKTMLLYLDAIGRVVWLPTGYVFTDPTIAPKIAAKFISPRDVRLALLKKATANVQILDQTEIGSLLDIDTSDNELYVS